LGKVGCILKPTLAVGSMFAVGDPQSILLALFNPIN
jgi:hypothetical protein